MTDNKSQRAKLREDFKNSDMYNLLVNKGVENGYYSQPVKWDASFDSFAHYQNGYNFSKRGPVEMGEPMIDIDIVPKNGVNLTERELLNCIRNLSSDNNFDVVEASKDFEKLSVVDDFGVRSIQADYVFNNKISCGKADAMLQVQLYSPDRIELNQYNYARVLLNAQEDIKDMVFYLNRLLPIHNKTIYSEKNVAKTKSAKTVSNNKSVNKDIKKKNGPSIG